MFLDDRESTRRLREWFTELTTKDTGGRTIRGTSSVDRPSPVD
jgi:hypothetical protein